MHDRVVDRAAPHATPAELEVRDWLLVALSFATGIYEAICFLTFGKVFTAAQTGNLVLLGIGVAGTHEPAGPNAVTVVISIGAFAVGAAMAMPILKAFDGDREVDDKNVFHVWPRRVSIVLAVALALQIAFLVVWVTASSPANLAYVLIALSAFGMGLQMNAVRSLHVPGISATAFTATFTGLVSGLTTWSLNAHSAWRLTATVIALPVGAFLGDWMLGHAQRYAPTIPTFVIAAVVVIAWMALKPRGTASPAGEQSTRERRAVN